MSIRYADPVVQSVASLGGDTVDLVMLIDMANSFLTVRAVEDVAPGVAPYDLKIASWGCFQKGAMNRTVPSARA